MTTEWSWPKNVDRKQGPKDDNVWTFGPDLPEPLCCAGQANMYEPHLFGGSTPDGGFLVKVLLLFQKSSQCCSFIDNALNAAEYPYYEAD